DMLEDTLDLEADLGIDTVKQVEIFGKISAAYQLKVPENLKLKDLNTIDKLVAYMKGKVDPALLKTQETLIPEPAAPVPDVPAQVKASAPSSLSAEIKKVISDQTGYEVDMLEDTLDLEADLGIDTVKQVEIFGKISAAYSLKVPENLKLKDLNSIAKLVAYMETRIPAPENIKAAPAPPPGAPAQATFTPLAQPLKKPGHSGVKRFTLVLCKAEKTESLENPFENKTILVTQDSYGFSDQICRDIRKKGGRPITMGKSPGSDIKADLADPMAVLKALQTATRVTDIRGLIHLAPIDGYLAGQKTFDFLSKKSNHTTRMTVALTSFFTMIKALKPQLDQDGSLIASLSFNSVVFPYETGFKGVIHPEFAGMAGLLKTVNKEYSKTRVRIIDFAEDKPRNKVNEISTLFIKDLCSKDKRVEKGYKNSVPWSLTMQETPLVKDTSFMHDGDTVLVTGGAMGITYEILKQTAQTHKINLIIMGRSTIHDLDPSYLLPGVTGSLIMSQVKARMKNAKPLDIKKAVDRIMRTREAVLNIKRLEGQGIKVFYENGDVANYAAVEQVVKKYPSITGVIHAAGLEESQFIEKKELASFKRVIDVKVTGLHNLIKAMINRDYRYFITFSSVTARFGNEGQADYTAANDMIGKMLMKEKINHPNRHYKVYAWTAWSGAGMAENDTVKKVLESRGITFLPLDEGIDFFVSDLENTQDLEVVITGPDRDADVEGLFSPISGQVESMKTTNLSRSYPFLDSKDIETGTDGRFHRTLNLGRDLFLHDHTMEGTPIFLGATGIETMAEAAAAVQGGQEKLVEVKDFSIPYGIKILKGRPKDIIIEAHAIHGKDYTCRITSVFTNPKGQVMGDATLHYQGLFTFDTEYLPSEQIPIPEFTPVSYKGDAESLIYHPRRLFMEDLFKTLTDVVSFDGELLITTFCDASPKPFFKDVYKPSFLTDVVAVDAMFQTGGLLEFFTTSTLVLPYKIKKLSVHKRVQKGETYYCLTRKTAQADETNTYDLVLVDMNGKVHITIHEFQMVKLGALDEPYRITDRIKILESA
ncbi:MAG: SDR family NAD(P)-dependent oxidoreductase, partial [Proteobacteria bacterium]|nr:SDR family NAD(P)-dependent oxidoreductase [Pseudomonadota bacterium]